MLSSEQFKALRAEMEALPTTAQPLGFTGQEYAALAGKEWPAVADLMTLCPTCGKPMWAGPPDERQRPCWPCQQKLAKEANPMARDPESDPLKYAMLVIESYQMDLRNSDQLLSPENIERLRAGETLAAIGFCQGSIYTGALAHIRALRDKEATHADDDGPTPTR